MDARSGRARLDFNLSRRAFFSALIHEVKSLTGTVHGTQPYSLAELGSLPDEQLARLVPEIQPALAIHVEGERLVSVHRQTGATLDLVPATRENVLALNLFDGRLTLATAGRRLAQQMGWSKEQGFHHVRDLFLELVGRLICLPRNTLGPDA